MISEAQGLPKAPATSSSISYNISPAKVDSHKQSSPKHQRPRWGRPVQAQAGEANPDQDTLETAAREEIRIARKLVSKRYLELYNQRRKFQILRVSQKKRIMLKMLIPQKVCKFQPPHCHTGSLYQRVHNTFAELTTAKVSNKSMSFSLLILINIFQNCQQQWTLNQVIDKVMGGKNSYSRGCDGNSRRNNRRSWQEQADALLQQLEPTTSVVRV